MAVDGLPYDGETVKEPTLEFIDDAATSGLTFLDPPFQHNAANVARFPPEVSGNNLLQVMARRLGWRGLSGKRILDFGCGVRFARTIVNLGLDLGLYVGVDLNPDSIAWLQANVTDERLKFVHVNDHNPCYNPDGNPDGDYDALRPFAACQLDAACMFSVITHQRPVEARRTFVLLRELLGRSGLLYFTAFLDTRFSEYGEGVEGVCLESTYNPTYLTELLSACGWTVERMYLPSTFQRHAVVCSPR